MEEMGERAIFPSMAIAIALLAGKASLFFITL